MNLDKISNTPGYQYGSTYYGKNLLKDVIKCVTGVGGIANVTEADLESLITLLASGHRSNCRLANYSSQNNINVVKYLVNNFKINKKQFMKIIKKFNGDQSIVINSWIKKNGPIKFTQTDKKALCKLGYIEPIKEGEKISQKTLTDLLKSSSYFRSALGDIKAIRSDESIYSLGKNNITVVFSHGKGKGSKYESSDDESYNSYEVSDFEDDYEDNLKSENVQQNIDIDSILNSYVFPDYKTINRIIQHKFNNDSIIKYMSTLPVSLAQLFNYNKDLRVNSELLREIYSSMSYCSYDLTNAKKYFVCVVLARLIAIANDQIDENVIDYLNDNTYISKDIVDMKLYDYIYTELYNRGILKKRHILRSIKSIIKYYQNATAVQHILPYLIKFYKKRWNNREIDIYDIIVRNELERDTTIYIYTYIFKHFSPLTTDILRHAFMIYNVPIIIIANRQGLIDSDKYYNYAFMHISKKLCDEIFNNRIDPHRENLKYIIPACNNEIIDIDKVEEFITENIFDLTEEEQEYIKRKLHYLSKPDTEADTKIYNPNELYSISDIMYAVQNMSKKEFNYIAINNQLGLKILLPYMIEYDETLSDKLSLDLIVSISDNEFRCKLYELYKGLTDGNIVTGKTNIDKKFKNDCKDKEDGDNIKPVFPDLGLHKESDGESNNDEVTVKDKPKKAPTKKTNAKAKTKKTPVKATRKVVKKKMHIVSSDNESVFDDSDLLSDSSTDIEDNLLLSKSERALKNKQIELKTKAKKRTNKKASKSKIVKDDKKKTVKKIVKKTPKGESSK